MKVRQEEKATIDRYVINHFSLWGIGAWPIWRTLQHSVEHASEGRSRGFYIVSHSGHNWGPLLKGTCGLLPGGKARQNLRLRNAGAGGWKVGSAYHWGSRGEGVWVGPQLCLLHTHSPSRSACSLRLVDTYGLDKVKVVAKSQPVSLR